MRGPTPHLLLQSAAAHHRCHGKTRICSIFGSDSPGSYFTCYGGNAPATKPAPPAQIPPPRSAQHLVPDVPIPLAMPGGTGCGCLPSRHRACLQGWREKRCNRLKVTPVQGKLQAPSLAQQAQVPASAQPSPAPLLLLTLLSPRLQGFPKHSPVCCPLTGTPSSPR